MAVKGKILQLCSRCIDTRYGLGTAHQTVTDQGYVDPNKVSNKFHTNVFINLL